MSIYDYQTSIGKGMDTIGRAIQAVQAMKFDLLTQEARQEARDREIKDERQWMETREDKRFKHDLNLIRERNQDNGITTSKDTLLKVLRAAPGMEDVVNAVSELPKDQPVTDEIMDVIKYVQQTNIANAVRERMLKVEGVKQGGRQNLENLRTENNIREQINSAKVKALANVIGQAYRRELDANSPKGVQESLDALEAVKEGIGARWYSSPDKKELADDVDAAINTLRKKAVNLQGVEIDTEKLTKLFNKIGAEGGYDPGYMVVPADTTGSFIDSWDDLLNKDVDF